MITKITIGGVASFKEQTVLETDKKINLIYGLNGTGKTTLSDYLYKNDDAPFSECAIEGLDDEDILVYNQKFIKEYFHAPDSDNVKGIFTLSKENKEAEIEIKNAENKIGQYEDNKTALKKCIEDTTDELNSKIATIENKVWDIKKKYTGGDRVLEFCLKNLKKSREILLVFISKIPKPNKKPDKTIDDIKKDVKSIEGENVQTHPIIPEIKFEGYSIENNSLFQKEILGNEDTQVAKLIKNLNNSDWVKQGLDYLPEDNIESPELCPFCQERTITQHVLDNIKSYFDESYKKDLKNINDLKLEYQNYKNLINSRDTYEANAFVLEEKEEFDRLYKDFSAILTSNEKNMEEKLKTPSKNVGLKSSLESIESFNRFIKEINTKINSHNEKIENKEETLSQLKKDFWDIMRWDYDSQISNYLDEKLNDGKKISKLSGQIAEIGRNIDKQEEIIIEAQKNTVNIDEAVKQINNNLQELGMNDFSIKKYDERFYKLVREKQEENPFSSFSEGEKMIISFLYFLELCKGKKNATDVIKKKIIVIDDPISSLSHIYVFNIGRLIKKEFFGSKN